MANVSMFDRIMDRNSSLSLYLLILMTIFMTEVQPQDEFPLVNLAQGTLKGKMVNSHVTAPFYSFQGIPYAKPPVGQLRFKAPVPPDPWNGTFEALQEGNICRQFNTAENKVYGSEDCLFINVFTPQLPGSEPLKPVMVFIHGGAYKVGSGNTGGFGPDYLVGAGVVFVSFNYRLDVLGLLSTEDSVVPGNAAMKDQVQALRWVQQNIAAFGGDPNKVTIFGHSAGGSSVHYLVISPMTKGLFQGAIAHSGSAVNPWALAVKPRESAFILGRALGYSGNSSEDLVGFLRTITCQRLLTTAQEAIPDRDKLRFLKMVFVPSVEPTVEGETSFLPDTPINLLNQGVFQKVPFISGATDAEGLIFMKISGITNNFGKVPEINRNFVKILKPELRFCKEDLCGDDMVARMKSFYFGIQDVNNDTLDNFVKLTTDLFFTEGIEYGVNLMASQSSTPVYLYEMTYDGGLAMFKIRDGAQNFSGVAHGDELGYLFKTSQSAVDGSPDANTRSRLITMWTNFAKTGNPTPEVTDDIPAWLPYTNSSANYLEIGTQLVMKKDMKKRQLDFWRELYNPTQNS